MISDLDIYRTASVLIREHGEDAALEAAQRADAMLEAGDIDGSAVWKRVLEAIKKIRRQEPLGIVVILSVVSGRGYPRYRRKSPPRGRGQDVPTFGNDWSDVAPS